MSELITQLHSELFYPFVEVIQESLPDLDTETAKIIASFNTYWLIHNEPIGPDEHVILDNSAEYGNAFNSREFCLLIEFDLNAAKPIKKSKWMGILGGPPKSLWIGIKDFTAYFTVGYQYGLSHQFHELKQDTSKMKNGDRGYLFCEYTRNRMMKMSLFSTEFDDNDEAFHGYTRFDLRNHVDDYMIDQVTLGAGYQNGDENWPGTIYGMFVMETRWRKKMKLDECPTFQCFQDMLDNNAFVSCKTSLTSSFASEKAAAIIMTDKYITHQARNPKLQRKEKTISYCSRNEGHNFFVYL